MIRVLNIKYKVLSILAVFAVFLSPAAALAHVEVKPTEVGVGKYQTFNVSVPNERDVQTTSVRLVIPAELEHVSPNVKPGWNVEVKKAGQSMKGVVLNNGQKAPDPETVTEIIWSGGSIPEGMRDDFFFSAKTPAEPGTLKWNAYQTYSDGKVVSWDLEAKDQPKGTDGQEVFTTSGPYSKTEVINDLATPEPQAVTASEMQQTNLPLILSAAAIIISGLALGISLRQR